ncbi:MAG: MBL fold metallo-hydrolase [Coprothermobacterota bacterium]|nr:MBL fold metallo-hydrolase [Coprothermobacterota bacterium]
MKLTFYDGVKTVGGNKIVLEADGTNLLLDFGTNFSKVNLYFDEFMQPRLGKGILDLLELDILPPLQGLFRPDLELEGIWERKKNHPFWREIVIDAILLSHSHLDHAGFLRFLRADVPIYSSLETALILKVTQDTGKDDGYYFFQERTINEEGHLKKESKKNGSKITGEGFVSLKKTLREKKNGRKPTIRTPLRKV